MYLDGERLATLIPAKSVDATNSGNVYGDSHSDGSVELGGNSIAVTQGAGTYTVRLNSDLSYTLTKQTPNQKPIANAGPDQSVTLNGSSVSVTFNGNGSSDPDGNLVSYSWTSSAWSGSKTGPTPSHSFTQAGSYLVTLTVTDNQNATASDTVNVTVLPANGKQRTVIFIYGQTLSGQDMFMRGGIDSGWSNANRGTQCTGSVGGDHNKLCSIPIVHRNTLHAYTSPWRVGDNHLDWGKLKPEMDGREPNQTGKNSKGEYAVGTPAVWTTNDPNYAKKVDVVGNGYTPLNTYGPHYWMLDVDIDCSASGSTVNGWFEFKSYISNGPAWEPNVTQTQFGGLTPPPYSSGNHFAKCGKINVFKRGDAQPVAIKDFPAAVTADMASSNNFITADATASSFSAVYVRSSSGASTQLTPLTPSNGGWEGNITFASAT